MYKTEEPPLEDLAPPVRPPFGIKWVIKYLFKYTTRQGLDHFQDQLEILSDSNVN
jgi:hypothetical protein